MRSNTGPDSVPPSPYARPDGVVPSQYVRPLIIKGNRRHQMRKAYYDASFENQDPKGTTNDTGQQKKPPQDRTGNYILNDVNTAV